MTKRAPNQEPDVRRAFPAVETDGCSGRHVTSISSPTRIFVKRRQPGKPRGSRSGIMAPASIVLVANQLMVVAFLRGHAPADVDAVAREAIEPVPRRVNLTEKKIKPPPTMATQITMGPHHSTREI